MTHSLMTGQALDSAGQLPQAVSANHGGGQRSCDLNPWDPSQRLLEGSRRTWFSLATTVCCANWDWTNKTTDTDTNWTQTRWLMTNTGRMDNTRTNESMTNKIKGTNLILKTFIRSLKVPLQLICSSPNLHNRGGEPTPTGAIRVTRANYKTRAT